MNILLHSCCGPCSVMSTEVLKNEGIVPDLYWYNPNIHPYTEYRSRKNSLIEFAEAEGLKVYVNDFYGLREFIKGTPDLDNRCSYCYYTRLNETARFAAQHGYEFFSTTLTISPYQNHQLITGIGEEAGNRHGVKFIYKDFRPVFREGQKKAREINLYMQKYCGCIFSEEERYNKACKSR